MKINSYRQLRIWQESLKVVKSVYTISKLFPREELYGLSAQMRRSAISIPSNIAEGFKRFHIKEYIQFLHISMGSIAELETQLIISKELGFAEGKVIEAILKQLEIISKMTSALLVKIKKE